MATVADLSVEARRVVDRLRSMPEARLARGAADRTHALSQWLYDRTAELVGDPRRGLPRLPDLASGDQLAVMLADLAAVDPPPDVVTAALDRLVALRRSL